RLARPRADNGDQAPAPAGVRLARGPQRTRQRRSPSGRNRRAIRPTTPIASGSSQPLVPRLSPEPSPSPHVARLPGVRGLGVIAGPFYYLPSSSRTGRQEPSAAPSAGLPLPRHTVATPGGHRWRSAPAQTTSTGVP